MNMCHQNVFSIQMRIGNSLVKVMAISSGYFMPYFVILLSAKSSVCTQKYMKLSNTVSDCLLHFSLILDPSQIQIKLNKIFVDNYLTGKFQHIDET